MPGRSRISSHRKATRHVTTVQHSQLGFQLGTSRSWHVLALADAEIPPTRMGRGELGRLPGQPKVTHVIRQGAPATSHVQMHLDEREEDTQNMLGRV